MTDGIQLAEFLTKQGYAVKAKTKSSITIIVPGNRTSKMLEIADSLSNLGARVDSSLKGSSIGGIVVGSVKITLKSEGRSSGGLDVEAKAIEDLYDSLMRAIIITGAPITVQTNKEKINGVTDVIKTPGTPKSDFHLADERGRPLLHISHKKGSTPRDFQQWGGVTEPRILDHKEVQQFALACRKLYGSTIPSGQSVYTDIKDKSLKMMSVFGVDFDKSGIHTNKVDVLLQGDPGLEIVSEGTFKLTATGHVHYHGDLPDGGFDPVLAMIYKGDRDQLGIKGARASIYPRGGRTFKQKL